MKVKKNNRIIAMIIMFIMLIEILCTASYASFIEGVLGESGPAPSPPTPSDSPSNPSPPSSSTPSGPTIPTETIVHYTSISGNVNEDLGYSVGTAGTDNQKQTTPIEGVIVNLKQGGNIVASTRTDASGNYKFTPSPGTYSLEFVYGQVGSDVSASNSSLVENILKYNGQDYFASSVPGEEEYLDSEKIEIEQSGKGALQLYIALDCSYSMRTTEVEYNGETKTRLAVVVDAAKKLCEELIDSGNNIYIGLVFFSGTNYRAVSLTKDLSQLNSALDDINNNGWQTANTNVVGALDKSYQSFYNNTEDSNRYLTILSDGVPTSDGNTQTYYTDSEEEAYRKLDIVSESTINKIEELKGNGVNVISLITKSTDEEENSYVQNIFAEHSSKFWHIEDGYKTVDLIKGELKDFLISSTDEKYYSSSHTVTAGYEDEGRREEVDSIFEDESGNSILNYKNTIMFDQIDNFNSVDMAQELSNKTYMTVQGGENYTITAVPNPARIEIKETDPETGEEKVVKIIQHVAAEYTGKNLTLSRRPGFALATNITATGLRVILQSGQVLDTQTREPGSDFPMLETLDNELSYGATIQIEYTVSIKNDSSIQCEHLEMLNYLPEKFVYDENISLITGEGINGDTGWEYANLESLFEQGMITQDTLDEYGNHVALKLTLDNNGEGENGFYIAPGGEYTIKYVVSRMISNLNDIENPDFGIASEVLSYGDQGIRRMTYTVGANISHQYAGAYPGDIQDMDYSNESTNEVIVIPPTGRQKDNITIYEILRKSVFTLIFDKITI